MTSKVRQPATGSMFLGFLRTATLVAGLAGAVGSLGLLFHARRWCQNSATNPFCQLPCAREDARVPSNKFQGSAVLRANRRAIPVAKKARRRKKPS